jgi:hypothetical protein
MSCLKSMRETANRKSECYIPGDDVTPHGTEWSVSIYYSINVFTRAHPLLNDESM